MKLIATLATLAALVGQTEAATAATAIKATHTQIGTKLCTDKISLKAEVTDAVAASGSTAAVAADVIGGKVIKFKLPDGFSLSTTFLKATHIEGVTYSASNQAATTSTETFDVASNTLTFTLTTTAPSGGSAPADGDDITLKLQALCNHMTTIDSSGKYSWTAKSQNVKFQLETADTAIVESSDETSTASAPATALKNVLLQDIPSTASAEGKFKILFTAPAAAAAATFGVNLPAGYKYKSGCICKLGPAAAPVAFSALGGDSSAPIEFQEFTTDTPTGASITAADLAFECDKVVAPAQIPTAKLGDVAIRYGTSATVTTHAGYATSTITKSPTQKPTAKTADSPASVATASGVVVGALGVAALFLA